MLIILILIHYGSKMQKKDYNIWKCNQFNKVSLNIELKYKRKNHKSIKSYKIKKNLQNNQLISYLLSVETKSLNLNISLLIISHPKNHYSKQFV